VEEIPMTTKDLVELIRNAATDARGGEYIDLNPKLVRKSLVAVKRNAEDDDISARVQALLKRNKGR
jgi:hypothetical protein